MDPIKFVINRVIDLVVRVRPIHRTKKAFGHPVYGRYGASPLHMGSMWPTLAMEPPSPEDLAEVAHELRRASMDLVEAPWDTDHHPKELKKLKKAKKKKTKKHRKTAKKHLRRKGSLIKRPAKAGERVDPVDSTSLIKEQENSGSSNDGEFALRRHHHHGKHHKLESDGESSDAESYDVYTPKGSDEETV